MAQQKHYHPNFLHSEISQGFSLFFGLALHSLLFLWLLRDIWILKYSTIRVKLNIEVIVIFPTCGTQVLKQVVSSPPPRGGSYLQHLSQVFK